MICDTLAFGLVHRNVVGQEMYDNNTHRMVHLNDITYTEYTYLHDQFDEAEFHYDLCSKYFNRFY